MLFLVFCRIVVLVVTPLRGCNPTLVAEPGSAGHRPPGSHRWLLLVFRSRIDSLREPTFDTTYQRRQRRSRHFTTSSVRVGQRITYRLHLFPISSKSLVVHLFSLVALLLCRFGFHYNVPRTSTTTTTCTLHSCCTASRPSPWRARSCNHNTV